MKKLLSVKKLTAFILVLTMAMLLPVQTVASATVGKYVSELYVAYGKDADAVKKTLSDKGYTPVDLSADNNDSDNRGLLRYNLIQSPDGKGDLNAYDGKQWNALYSSQNTQAGKPIVVPDDGAPFIVKTNDAENPAGYKAVKNFDEIYAANLNANTKKASAPSVYLFYSCPGESANTTEVKDGDKPEEETQGTTDATAPADGQSAPAEKKQYIASVYLSCEGSETIAKSKLTQQGYKVIDGKKGYVPVCYFGSAAYNFDACVNSTKWDKAKYIFFSPSEKFTSGTEYISGLFFVSGANAEEKGWSLTEYAEKLGGKLLGNENFTKGRQWHKKVMGPESGMNCYVKNMQTYLCYTTTHDPKRAMYMSVKTRKRG